MPDVPQLQRHVFPKSVVYAQHPKTLAENLAKVAQTPKEETAETTTKASPPVAEVAQLALKMMEAKERMDKLPTKFVKPEEEEVMEEQTPKHAQLDRKRPMEGVPRFVKPEEEEPEEGASQAVPWLHSASPPQFSHKILICKKNAMSTSGKMKTSINTMCFP